MATCGIARGEIRDWRARNEILPVRQDGRKGIGIRPDTPAGCPACPYAKMTAKEPVLCNQRILPVPEVGRHGRQVNCKCLSQQMQRHESLSVGFHARRVWTAWHAQNKSGLRCSVLTFSLNASVVSDMASPPLCMLPGILHKPYAISAYHSMKCRECHILCMAPSVSHQDACPLFYGHCPLSYRDHPWQCPVLEIRLRSSYYALTCVILRF